MVPLSSEYVHLPVTVAYTINSFFSDTCIRVSQTHLVKMSTNNHSQRSVIIEYYVKVNLGWQWGSPGLVWHNI